MERRPGMDSDNDYVGREEIGMELYAFSAPLNHAEAIVDSEHVTQQALAIIALGITSMSPDFVDPRNRPDALRARAFSKITADSVREGVLFRCHQELLGIPEGFGAIPNLANIVSLKRKEFSCRTDGALRNAGPDGARQGPGTPGAPCGNRLAT